MLLYNSNNYNNDMDGQKILSTTQKLMNLNRQYTKNNNYLNLNPTCSSQMKFPIKEIKYTKLDNEHLIRVLSREQLIHNNIPQHVNAKNIMLVDNSKKKIRSTVSVNKKTKLPKYSYRNVKSVNEWQKIKTGHTNKDKNIRTSSEFTTINFADSRYYTKISSDIKSCTSNYKCPTTCSITTKCPMTIKCPATTKCSATTKCPVTTVNYSDCCTTTTDCPVDSDEDLLINEVGIKPIIVSVAAGAQDNCPAVGCRSIATHVPVEREIDIWTTEKSRIAIERKSENLSLPKTRFTTIINLARARANKENSRSSTTGNHIESALSTDGTIKPTDLSASKKWWMQLVVTQSSTTTRHRQQVNKNISTRRAEIQRERKGGRKRNRGTPSTGTPCLTRVAGSTTKSNENIEDDCMSFVSNDRCGGFIGKSSLSRRDRKY